MGIYTERKISPVQGFFILAAAFASLYGVWLLTGGTELVRSEGVYAAAAAGFYRDVPEAMAKMKPGIRREYLPDPERSALLEAKYRKYLHWAEVLEKSRP